MFRQIAALALAGALTLASTLAGAAAEDTRYYANQRQGVVLGVASERVSSPAVAALALTGLTDRDLSRSADGVVAEMPCLGEAASNAPFAYAIGADAVRCYTVRIEGAEGYAVFATVGSRLTMVMGLGSDASDVAEVMADPVLLADALPDGDLDFPPYGFTEVEAGPTGSPI